MHLPHWVMPANTGRAQVWQRGTGWANCATQSLHSARAGQAWHIAHWLGRRLDIPSISWRNMLPIYLPLP